MQSEAWWKGAEVKDHEEVSWAGELVGDIQVLR